MAPQSVSAIDALYARDEHAEQSALIAWAKTQEKRIPALRLLHAIPNGGKRHPGVARRLKEEGVRAGVPDLCLPVPRCGRNGLYIEMKAKGGRPTPEQRQWIADLTAQGYRAVVCVGWEAARDEIINHLSSED